MVGPVPADWSVRASDASVSEVRPGLWRLRLPLAWPEISHVNAYALARDDGGVTLVDCGTAGHPSCWDALAAALAATGNDVTDIRELVVTHAHSDHLGLAARVVAESGCAFRMHPQHEAFTDGAREPERIRAARERRALREGVPMELLHLYGDPREETDGALAPLPPQQDLVAGEHVQSALGSWSIVPTPGHAPSHVCLYEPSQRLLIAGDLVSRVFAPWFDYGYSPDPVAEFARSLDTVAALDVDVAFPGHGRPIEDLDDLLAEHRRALAERLSAVEAAVARGPAPGYVLNERVFGPTSSDYAVVWQLTETLAYLRHLRLAGRIVREEPAGEPFLYRPAS